MGKKYIIELEEVPFIQHFNNGIGESLYRVKGFNSLVFDRNSLQMLTPYTEPDLEQVRKEAYDKGYDDAKSGYDNGFENGMIVAWDAARNIILEENNGGFSTSTFYKIFGFEVSSIDVLKTLNASECIEKIRQYEQEKEEIQVGDEVNAPFGKAIVVNIDSVAEKIWLVYADGYGGFEYFKDAPTKTGRHFPEIAEVLQKMREET